ncbi:MAG: ph-response sensor protein [Sclerophora amabilis]|nr:MAG: ph-response sensor protein [Sclerophora amabilis]
MAAGPLTAHTSSAGRTGRKLLSRLRSSTFSSRSRNLTEFYVRPADPHRHYAPGDLVSGAVVLTLTKPIRVTHLVVALCGYVRVFKNGIAGDGLGTENFVHPGQGRRNGEYFGHGFASLFQDEVVLCGEGRLDAGVYEFKFELEFPGNGLPSSIDFEKGTIAYVITSTMTRPTAISPTTTCSRKVQLVETVDVGPLPPPKPRLISLEPIVRRPKAKADSRSASVVGGKSTDSRTTLSEASNAGASDAASVRTSVEASQPAPPAPPPPSQPPQSPALSEVSEESTVSDSTGSVRQPGSTASVARSNKQASTSGDTAFQKKTITATIELLRGGCLRGDPLPVKVSVNHNKRIKSVYGIIITLYRQGRIDSHPILPIGPTTKDKIAGMTKHEEYYPKSKSGLGGLSLSSAGSSHTFRKDLSQTFAPLIVDPRTLTAVVKASVRVPEDAFSTISSVPGAMITFRYYVEVVVDLGGKLAGQDRFLPRLGTVDTPAPTNRADEGLGGVLAAWGGNVMETDQLRREKGVVSSVFEVLVGSTDSARGRRIDSSRVNSIDRQLLGDSTLVTPPAPVDNHQHPETHNSSHTQETSHHTNHHDYCYGHDPSHVPPHRSDVPPPDFAEDDELDEKSRMRRAEERLLPSQPPIDDAAAPSTVPSNAGPSAPVLPENELGPPDRRLSLAPSISFSSGQAGPSQLSTTRESRRASDPAMGTDDKQELERRRLAAEASGPSDFPEDDGQDSGAGGPLLPSAPPEPSAPVLTEEDEYSHLGRHRDDSHPSVMGGDTFSQDHLPRYER